MRYDVIVVGSGAAGAPLAARLSEDAQSLVLLLEAGPTPCRTQDFPSELLDAGTLKGAAPGHANNWALKGELTPSRPYTVARGKILGGSSTINGTYFVRARKEDFDRWSQGGNDEWSFDKVLPFYKKMESDMEYGATAIHGNDGPMKVTRQSQDHRVSVAFKSAAAELGFPEEIDKNDQGKPGYGPLPMNVSGGVRWNTGIAYINPVLGRKNLTVQGYTHVLKVIFSGRQAIGVEVERDGIVSKIYANEIVLSAGAVHSPHLLMLSGIGPRADLEKQGIAVLVDLPGVGKGFSDHPQVAINWRTKVNIVDYQTTYFLADCLNFNSTESEFGGDLEILQLTKPLDYILSESQPKAERRWRQPLWSRFLDIMTPKNDLTLLVGVQAQSSRGKISLQTADPKIQPLIEYRYMSHESDLRRMREAVRTAVRILTTESFKPLFGRLTELDNTTLHDDILLNSWIREHIGTAVHLCGSAKFGDAEDPDAVVDQYGRVHGVQGLRVADTSILPSAPLRGPAATAVLIGELMADFMRRGRATKCNAWTINSASRTFG